MTQETFKLRDLVPGDVITTLDLSGSTIFLILACRPEPAPNPYHLWFVEWLKVEAPGHVEHKSSRSSGDTDFVYPFRSFFIRRGAA